MKHYTQELHMVHQPKPITVCMLGNTEYARSWGSTA
jgi:hypothetical protein